MKETIREHNQDKKKTKNKTCIRERGKGPVSSRAWVTQALRENFGGRSFTSSTLTTTRVEFSFRPSDATSVRSYCAHALIKHMLMQNQFKTKELKTTEMNLSNRNKFKYSIVLYFNLKKFVNNLWMKYKLYYLFCFAAPLWGLCTDIEFSKTCTTAINII